jgi:hypothetical protein
VERQSVAGTWSATREGVALNLDATLADAHRGRTERHQDRTSSPMSCHPRCGQAHAAGRRSRCRSLDVRLRGRRLFVRQASQRHLLHRRDREGRTASTKLSLAGVTGSGHLGDQTIEVRDLAFDAAYDPATKQITLEKLKIDSDRLQASSQARWTRRDHGR